MSLQRRRLLAIAVTPVLLVVAVIAVVVAVEDTVALMPGEHLEVQGLPPRLARDLGDCRRDIEGSPASERPFAIAGVRVTSAQVISCPVAFDGRRVLYAGEVVGDLLHRDGGAWVLVNDDDYALHVGPLPSHRDHRGTNSGLSVWLPDHLAARLTGLGRPDQRGDVVVMQGRIVRTDSTDGGGLTLRADELTVLAVAEALSEPLHRPRAALAGVSLLAAALVSVAGHRSTRRRPGT